MHSAAAFGFKNVRQNPVAEFQTVPPLRGYNQGVAIWLQDTILTRQTCQNSYDAGSEVSTTSKSS